jgi:predicted O-methyltransferase YrrM
MIGAVNATRRGVAAEILAGGRVHDERQSDRLARFRNVEPETAELLGVLIRATAARRILELGTSNGYSTIWLADAAQDTGGAVTSVEIDPERTALARASLERAGVSAAAAHAGRRGRAGAVARRSMGLRLPRLRARGRRGGPTCCARCGPAAGCSRSTTSSPTLPRWRRWAS